MTVAALEAKALQVALAGESHRLANRFFRAAATVIANPWAIVIGNDLQLLRRDQGPRHRRAAFLPWYVDRVQIAARRDPVVANAFQEVDAIVAPVSPFPAFRIGEKVADPVAMYLSDIYTITGSLAGIPCMSVPCGRTAEGLPAGMQILTRHFDETTMFRLAHALEQAQRPLAGHRGAYGRSGPAA